MEEINNWGGTLDSKFVMDNVLGFAGAKLLIREREARPSPFKGSWEFMAGEGFPSIFILHYNGKVYYKNGGEFHTPEAIKVFGRYLQEK